MLLKLSVLTILITLWSCGLKPGEKSGGGSSADPGDATERFAFVSLNRPFKADEFGNKSHRIDAASLGQTPQLRLMNPDGLAWSVDPSSIDAVTFYDLNLSFKNPSQIWLTNDSYFWRMDLDNIMRTVQPIDPSRPLDVEQELAGFEAKAAVGELNEKGELRVLSLSSRYLVTRSDKEVLLYTVTGENGISRKEIASPDGEESWEALNILSAGECTENCLWFLNSSKLFVYFPQTKTSAARWLNFSFGVRMSESALDKVVSLDMEVSIDEQNQLILGPLAFMTTSDGIYVSQKGFDQIFTSRVFDANYKYEWKNVDDLSRDYCTKCHEGFLGLTEEKNWKDRKDVILKYILPAEKDKSYTMPPKDSFEAKHMSDDEREIMMSWLKAQGADAAKVQVNETDSNDGPKRFALSDELLAVIDGGYGRCLNCHGQDSDNMRLKTWWLNPVRNNRSGLNGKEAAIASLRTTAGWKMPIGATLTPAQIDELEALLQAVDTE